MLVHAGTVRRPRLWTGNRTETEERFRRSPQRTADTHSKSGRTVVRSWRSGSRRRPPSIRASPVAALRRRAGAQTGARAQKALQIGTCVKVSTAVIRLRRIEGSNPSPSDQSSGSRREARFPAVAGGLENLTSQSMEVDVFGSPLVCVLTGAPLAHGQRSTPRLPRQQRGCRN